MIYWLEIENKINFPNFLKSFSTLPLHSTHLNVISDTRADVRVDVPFPYIQLIWMLFQIQEQMYEYHQKGLTMDKSAQYSEKNAAKTRRQAQVWKISVTWYEN
jgi:hypothetical protein